MGLSGRNAVVTGGASGIGRAICLRLARDGADVAVLDLDQGGGRQGAGEGAALHRRGGARGGGGAGAARGRGGRRTPPPPPPPRATPGEQARRAPARAPPGRYG